MAYGFLVRFERDPAKDRANRQKHGLGFNEVQELFTSAADYLELFDAAHSDEEERLIAIGPVRRGIVVVVWVERIEEVVRVISARFATPEERAISARQRKRLIDGQFETGDDIVALRGFVGLSQARFAQALGISVHTLRNWEQGRRRPEGAAIALLRIAARHPRIVRENLASAA